MVNVKQIQSIAELPGPVLTAYLNTMPPEPGRHVVVPVCVTWMKSECKSITRKLPARERAGFQRQLDATRRYLQERHPREKSLMIVAGAGTWELVPLRIPVKNELHWGRPELSQLLGFMEQHRAIGIIVVDRKAARLFRYRLHEWILMEKRRFAVDVSQWKNEELGHVTGQGVHKTRGSQRNVFERRWEAQYKRLCTHTAERMAGLCKKEHLGGIFLVGTGELIRGIEVAMPRELRNHVVLIRKDLGKMTDCEVQKTLEPMIEDWEQQNERSQPQQNRKARTPGAVRCIALRVAGIKAQGSNDNSTRAL